MDTNTVAFKCVKVSLAVLFVIEGRWKNCHHCNHYSVNVNCIPHPRRWKQQISPKLHSVLLCCMVSFIHLLILVKTMTSDKSVKYIDLKKYFKIGYLITYLSTHIPCQNPEDSKLKYLLCTAYKKQSLQQCSNHMRWHAITLQILTYEGWSVCSSPDVHLTVFKMFSFTY